MAPLARDLGDEGEPFQWDEERRARLRAELDAYFFHLYGISREDTEYILESFQSESGGLKNNEIAKFGEYRTKRLVLAEYDRMAAAGLTMETPLTEGESGTYLSTLTPPPARDPATTDPLLGGRVCGHPGTLLAHPRDQRTWYVEARAATLVRSSS